MFRHHITENIVVLLVHHFVMTAERRFSFFFFLGLSIERENRFLDASPPNRLERICCLFFLLFVVVFFWPIPFFKKMDGTKPTLARSCKN